MQRYNWCIPSFTSKQGLVLTSNDKGFHMMCHRDYKTLRLQAAWLCALSSESRLPTSQYPCSKVEVYSLLYNSAEKTSQTRTLSDRVEAFELTVGSVQQNQMKTKVLLRKIVCTLFFSSAAIITWRFSPGPKASSLASSFSFSVSSSASFRHNRSSGGSLQSKCGEAISS